MLETSNLRHHILVLVWRRMKFHHCRPTCDMVFSCPKKRHGGREISCPVKKRGQMRTNQVSSFLVAQMLPLMVVTVFWLNHGTMSTYSYVGIQRWSEFFVPTIFLELQKASLVVPGNWGRVLNLKTHTTNTISASPNHKDSNQSFLLRIAPNSAKLRAIEQSTN